MASKTKTTKAATARAKPSRNTPTFGSPISARPIPSDGKVGAAPKTKSAALPDGVPTPGSTAPAITLTVGDGESLKLSSFKGDRNVVLYFYPKDDTPGCTKQACAFQKDMAKLSAADTVLIGVSPDSLARHAKFKDKYGLDFILAADEATSAAQKYGVWAEKSLYGRKFMGIVRTTFLIDKQGRVARVWSKVKVEGHAAEVLAAAKALG